MTAVCNPSDWAETLEVLCRQAAYVMKDMDPAASLDDPVACEAMLNECRRLDGAMGDTVEKSSIRRTPLW